jgi:signal transduction histidine kinase
LTLRVERDQSAGIRADGVAQDAASARLAEHRRHLGRMYSILSHDLHAHLNSMVLNLELLQRTADAEPARIQRYASLIASELQALDKRLKAVVGQMRLADSPSDRFDWRAVTEDLAVIFESYARPRRIRLRTELPQIPVSVFGDRDVMNHVLTSLLVGVVDALPNGSLLSLALRTDRQNAVLDVSATPGAAADAPGAPEPIAFWTREPAAGALEAARAVLEPYHDVHIRVSSEPREPARLEIELSLAPLAV